MIDQLKAQIQTVRGLREVAAGARAARIAAFTQWQLDYAAEINNEKTATEYLLSAEKALRDMTIAVYQETGNKAPAPGVGIRETTQIRYNLKDALQWAIAHRICLKLDTAAFEKLAKTSSLEASDIDFVELALIPQATIAAELPKE